MNFKKPLISFLSPSNNLAQARKPTSDDSSTMKGNSNIIRRENRIKLKPGFSALDWHAKVASKGVKGQMITGLPILLQDSNFVTINYPQSIKQLQIGIPTYKIKPDLIINNEVLMKHQDIENDFWCVINGKVYCLTDYVNFHPGGIDIIYKNCSVQRNDDDPDCLNWFNKYHPWISYEKILETCYVGKYKAV